MRWLLKFGVGRKNIGKNLQLSEADLKELKAGEKKAVKKRQACLVKTKRKKEDIKKMPACPQCKKRNLVVQIVYGNLFSSPDEIHVEGLVVPRNGDPFMVGGCIYGPHSSKHYCGKCGKYFRVKEDDIKDEKTDKIFELEIERSKKNSKHRH